MILFSKVKEQIKVSKKINQLNNYTKVAKNLKIISKNFMNLKIKYRKRNYK